MGVFLIFEKQETHRPAADDLLCGRPVFRVLSCDFLLIKKVNAAIQQNLKAVFKQATHKKHTVNPAILYDGRQISAGFGRAVAFCKKAVVRPCQTCWNTICNVIRKQAGFLIIRIGLCRFALDGNNNAETFCFALSKSAGIFVAYIPQLLNCFGDLEPCFLL